MLNNVLMRFENLRDFLNSDRMSVRDFAAHLGISTQYVNMLRNGERRPSPELAKKISKITGIPFERLLLPEETVTK